MMYAPTGLLLLAVAFVAGEAVMRGHYLDFEQQVDAVKWIAAMFALGVLLTGIQYVTWVAAELAR